MVGLRRAVVNDDLIADNKPPLEKDDDKVLVWPDLVYTELLCMIICTAAKIIVTHKSPDRRNSTDAWPPLFDRVLKSFLIIFQSIARMEIWR